MAHDMSGLGNRLRAWGILMSGSGQRNDVVISPEVPVLLQE